MVAPKNRVKRPSAGHEPPKKFGKKLKRFGLGFWSVHLDKVPRLIFYHLYNIGISLRYIISRYIKRETVIPMQRISRLLQV
jgi:hypothetical protein